jgi:hypothetical protein
MSEFLRDLHAMEDRRARLFDRERIVARDLAIAERTVLNAEKTDERDARRRARMAASQYGTSKTTSGEALAASPYNGRNRRGPCFLGARCRALSRLISSIPDRNGVDVS